MASRRAGAGQGDDLITAKLSGLPGFDLPVVARQSQFFAVLQLRQTFTLAVIKSGRAQRRITVEFVEQTFGALRRFKCVGNQARVGNQPANGLQGLRRHAFLGDVIRGTDKGQVGDQQDSGQQHQQRGQEFLADR